MSESGDNNENLQGQESQALASGAGLEQGLAALGGMDELDPETRKEFEDLQAAKEAALGTPAAESGKTPVAPVIDPNKPETAAPVVKKEDDEEEAAAPTKTPEEIAAEAAVKPEDEFVIESDLFGGKKSLVKKEEAPETPFSLEEGPMSFFKENFGVEDAASIPAKMLELKEQAEKFNPVNQRLQGVETMFKNMDPNLYKAVQAHVNGQDWKPIVNENVIDYSKTFEEVNIENLVESYHPGKITKEDWDEYKDPDGDESVKRVVQTMIDSSKTLFNTNKSTFTLKNEQAILDAQNQQAAFSESVNSAKAAFQERYPEMKPSLLTEIEQEFKNSTFTNIFYNADGTLKPDAFDRLAMAKHGGHLVEQYREIAERKANSKAKEDVLSRSSGTPTAPRGGVSTDNNQIRPEVQAEIDELMKL